MPNEVALCHEIGKGYSSGLPNLKVIYTPDVGELNILEFTQYTVLSNNREDIQNKLMEIISPQFPFTPNPFIYNLSMKTLDIGEEISL